MNNARKQWGETPWSREKVGYRDQVSSKEVKVAIVGGGLTGASTAYHLAKRGIIATVFEASRIGEGASGRTGGLVLEGTAAGPFPEVATCVPELEKLVSTEAIDCDLRLHGCWEIKHGHGSSKLTLPWSDGGQGVYVAKTVSGGVVEPVRLLSGILTAAAAMGARIAEQTPVRQIVATPQPAVELARETIFPEYVVVAANAWLPGLLRGVVKLRACLTFACATEPLDRTTVDTLGLGAHIPFYTADLPYLWGRTLADGRLMFGAGLVFGSAAELEAANVNNGSSHTALLTLQSRVRRLHPKLGEVQFPNSWGGPIAFAQDGVPLLGRHPSSAKVIVAGGYAGHGVALSVRVGQLISRAIADKLALPAWGKLTR